MASQKNEPRYCCANITGWGKFVMIFGISSSVGGILTILLISWFVSGFTLNDLPTFTILVGAIIIYSVGLRGILVKNIGYLFPAIFFAKFTVIFSAIFAVTSIYDLNADDNDKLGYVDKDMLVVATIFFVFLFVYNICATVIMYKTLFYLPKLLMNKKSTKSTQTTA